MTPEKLREAAETVLWMAEAYKNKPHCQAPAEAERFDKAVTYGQLAADACTTLAAASERVKELEVSAQRDGMHFMPSTLKMGIHPDTIEELHLHDELCCDLVAMRMDRLIQDLKAALTTAERERELLRGEVRRCWRIAEKRSIQDSEALDAYYLEQITSERSPEVRALVDAVGPSGATE